jgi:hypothetical protein
VRVAVLPAARARMLDDSVLWQPGVEERDVAVRTLLDRFVALTIDGDGSAVVRFVEDFGGLGACRHAMPPSHAARALGDDAEAIEARRAGHSGLCARESLPPHRARALKLRGRWYVEPVAMWRGFANEAAMVLRYVDAFRRGDDTAADAAALMAAMYRPASPDNGPAVGGGADPMVTLHGSEDAGALLARWIGERWMVLGNVRPTWTWEAGGFHVDHSGDGLMGALSIALAARVAQVEAGVTRAKPMHAAVCVNCGRSYTPARRPNPNRRTYCDDPDCKRARFRDSQRDRRAASARATNERDG